MCLLLVGTAGVGGWQNEEMRSAIIKRVEDDAGMRILPVFLPGAPRQAQGLPLVLRRYFRDDLKISFDMLDAERPYKRLVAGILGIPPIEVDDYLETQPVKTAKSSPPEMTTFKPEEMIVLLNKLDRSYGLEEMRELCLALGLDYDNLGGKGKRGNAYELILLMNRLGRMDALLNYCEKTRPNVQWR